MKNITNRKIHKIWEGAVMPVEGGLDLTLRSGLKKMERKKGGLRWPKKRDILLERPQEGILVLVPLPGWIGAELDHVDPFSSVKN